MRTKVGISFFCKDHARSLDGQPVLQMVNGKWKKWEVDFGGMYCYSFKSGNPEITEECRNSWQISVK